MNMILNALLSTKFLIILSLISTEVVVSNRISTPRFLFTTDPNLNNFERTNVASQMTEELLNGEQQDNYKGQHETLSRKRRNSEASPPAPEVAASRALCPHTEFVIHWTSRSAEESGLSSAGAIVALCRKGSTPPAVFVSYNHGLSWDNVTSKFQTDAGQTLALDDYINVDAKQKFVFWDSTNQKMYVSGNALRTVHRTPVSFKIDYVTSNPKKPEYLVAASGNRIYLSKNGGISFNLVGHVVKVNAYYWGDEQFGDKNTDLYIEGKVGTGGLSSSNIRGLKLDCGTPTVCGQPENLTEDAPLNDDIVDFLVKDNYMFVTKYALNKKNVIEMYVKYKRDGVFKKANIHTTSPLKELFVYDIHGSVIMLVANHRKNETNLYISLSKHGRNFSMSLPRVLYHNPDTEVSSYWLRRAVLYRFVDVRRVKALPWVYFATQLTVGPVGGRYLVSMVTYDKGGRWQRIRGPPRNKYNRQCLYPGCSLHVNLLYGSIYRYSPTTPLLSRESAPGLIMTTGVLGANLKITPDTYISRDGGLSFSLALNGKTRFTFGDHGGIVIATDYSSARTIKYSTDFKTFRSTKLADSSVSISRIMTEPGEKSAVFLIVGRTSGQWHVYTINATLTLGSPCTEADYTKLNLTDTSKGGGCEIRQVLQRNASKRCLAGPEHDNVAKISYKRCYCRRDDYRCDVAYVPDATGGCRNMGGVTIAPQCPPGQQFYNRSRGYVLIQGHDCMEDDVTKSEFSSVKTPCPVSALLGLIVRPSTSILYVALNKNLTLNVTLLVGHIPNIFFKWTLNSKITAQGLGMTTFSQRMSTLGPIALGIEASNARSSIRRTISVIVLRALDRSTLKLFAVPSLPTVKEKVSFALQITNVNPSDLGVLQYKWKIHQENPSQILLEKTTVSPVLQVTFNTTGSVTVMVTVHNKISKAIQASVFLIRPDMKIKNLRLSMDGRDIVAVWDPVDVSSYRIARYKVQYRKISSVTYQTASCNPSLNSPRCKITGVTAYTNYTIQISSITTDGSAIGPGSDPMGIKTPVAKPGQVAQVYLFTEGPLHIMASWAPPLLPNGVITAYQYKMYKAGTIGQKKTTSDVSKLSLSFDNLESNKDYFFEIAATNSAGTGEYKKTGPIRTGYDVPVLPPSDIRVIKLTSSTATLSWLPPKLSKDSMAFFAPKGYKIYMVNDGQPHLHQTVNKNTIQLTNLTAFEEYRVQISAFVSKKEGPRSAVIKFTTDKTAPVAPTNLRISDIKSHEATLAWDYSGDSSFVSTFVVHQLSPARMYGPKSYQFKTSPGTLTDLSPYTKYTFAMKAYGEMSSPLSKNITFTTAEDVPGTCLVVRARDIWPQSSSVRISWGAPIKKNGKITEYSVTWSSQAKDTVSGSVVVPADTAYYDVHHLRQTTEYKFEVKASTKIGKGPGRSQTMTTAYYPYGSELLIIPFDDSHAVKLIVKSPDFMDAFIKAVASTAKVDKKRIADVVLKPDQNTIEFILIPKEELQGKPGSGLLEEMDRAKAALMEGFMVHGFHTKVNAVKSAFVYSGPPKTESKSNTPVIVGIAVGAIVIILLLALALVLLFRKYRKHSSYNKFDNQFQYNHQDGTVRSISSDDIQVDTRPTPSYRHGKKDIETVPLADADELT